MKKKSWGVKQCLLLAGLLLFAAALLGGCKTNENENKEGEMQEQEPSIIGRLYLVTGFSEIVISYDEREAVRYLTGSSDEIAGVVDACQSLIGTDCVEVVRAVLAEMKSQGVFDETVWGNEKVIIARMIDETATEENPGEPNGLLYNELDHALAGTIQELGLASPYVLIDSEDCYKDKNPQYDGRKRDFISAEMAETIAYLQGGFANYPDPDNLVLLNNHRVKPGFWGGEAGNAEWVDPVYPEIEVYGIKYYSFLTGGVYACRVDGQSGMVLEILYETVVYDENDERYDVSEVMPPSENLSEHFEASTKRNNR